MSENDSIDRESLTSNTVAKLREICKRRGLLVSGKKSELVDRILEDAGVTEGPVATSEDDGWDEADALVMDDEPDETRERVDRVIANIENIVEAEVVEADVLPEEPSEVQEEEATLVVAEDDQPSLVISMPSISSLGDRWKALAAVIVVVLLVGAATTVFLQRSSGFEVAKSSYGDMMEFQVIASSVEIDGEEMLSVVRDSTGGILEPACGEVSMEMDGTGSVSVTEGPNSGAVETTDSLGRSGFLAAEKRISLDLDVDFEGRTWRDDAKTDCGNIRWVMSGNDIRMESTSWVELEKTEVKRTDTSISFSDVDSVTTNARTVTYDSEGLGGLGALLPTLSFPLTPIELHDFFGEAVIKEGARSSDPDLGWNSDWKWEVKKEFRDDTHGLVYPVYLDHEEIGRCYGHATILLYLQDGSPWPVKQVADIRLDKALQTNDCDFLVSTLSDELLPEGTLSISMTYSRISSYAGSKEIDWERNYLGSPNDGEDRPGTSTKRNWVDSMWDDTEIRQFDMEEAVSCLKSRYPDSQATLALESGGYIWRASWSRPNTEPEWNMSWVDEDDDSGWLVLQRSSEGCTISSTGSNDRGEVTWNRDSIPSTQTLSLLESRILDAERYPDLSQYIQSGESWNPQAQVGYRLSVTEDNEVLSLLPGDLGDGKVTMTAVREWEEEGRERSVDLAMDSETGEMVIWWLIDSPSE